MVVGRTSVTENHLVINNSRLLLVYQLIWRLMSTNKFFTSYHKNRTTENISHFFCFFLVRSLYIYIYNEGSTSLIRRRFVVPHRHLKISYRRCSCSFPTKSWLITSFWLKIHVVKLTVVVNLVTYFMKIDLNMFSIKYS